MASSIILDAGHGGQEPGAVFQGRREADDNLRLALAVGKLLQEEGYPVLYTRTQDIYQSPYEKAMLANRSGADVFVSIHRNSTPEPEQYSGVQTLVYEDQGLPGRMAENINRELEQVGFKNNGTLERKDLVVLRRTRMPAALVEVGYLNTAEDNERFDQDFDSIARAIADGIAQSLEQNGTQAQELHYRIQTGSFSGKGNAERWCEKMKREGFPAYLVRDRDHYLVCVGNFQHLENAVRMEQVLRSRRYSTILNSIDYFSRKTDGNMLL